MSFAMVFPGQGSQSLGMQAALASKYPEVVATYSEASEVLGYDLWLLTQTGPQEELDKTVITQPAMLAAGVATWRCWQAAGGAAPDVVAGHSLGEYSALVAAGAVDFADALRVVNKRANLMQEAVPAGKGGMAAILGLEDQAVIDACAKAEQGQVVRAVNFNSPGQVVIAGHKEAVERAIDIAKQAGAKRALLLRVSVPSHSPLLEAAANALADDLAKTAFGALAIPALNSVNVAPFADAQNIRESLRLQVFNPVRWTDTVRRLANEGMTLVIECGPGKVLAGLVKRIDRGITCVAIDDPDSLQKALDACRELTA